MKIINQAKLDMPSSSAQRKNLSDWLHLWKIDAELRARDEHEDERILDGEILRTAVGAGAVVEVDQIRLLYSDSAATWRRPVYLAVLEKADSDCFLAAPFSRFEYPALPGEWITGLEAPQLRVLCVWNAFIIRRQRLEGGWHVDDLDRNSRELALSIRSALRGEREFPLEAIDRTAPPLLNPLDPRWEYREEELELVEAIRPLDAGEDDLAKYKSRERAIEYRDKAAEGPGDRGDR